MAVAAAAAAGRPSPIGVAPPAESRRFHLNCSRFRTRSNPPEALSLVLCCAVVPHFASFFFTSSFTDGAESSGGMAREEEEEEEQVKGPA